MKVSRYTVSDGLVDNSIYSLVQDYQGFIWFGTRDGLQRFDGYSYKMYKHIPRDSTSIGNRDIYTLFEDSRNNLWAGSNSTLSVYDRKNDQFRNYHINPDRRFAKNIISISEDEQGRIWVVIPNQGIYHFDEDKEVFLPMDAVIPNFYTPWDAQKQVIRPDGLWEMEVTFNPHYIGDTLLYKFYIGNQNDSRSFEQDIPDGEGTHQNRLLVLDEQEIILDPVRFEGADTGNRSSNSGSSFEYTTPITAHFLLDTSGTKPFLKPGQSIGVAGHLYPLTWSGRYGTPQSIMHMGSNMYISTSGGLYDLNTKTGKVEVLRSGGISTQGPSTDELGRMIKDDQGIIWITSIFGLNRFDPQHQSFSHFMIDGPKAIDMAGSQYLNKIAEGQDGHLWMTSKQGRIYRFDPISKIFIESIPLNSTRLSNLMIDESGIIWVGTIDEGLIKLDPGVDKFNLYAQDSRDENTSYGKYIQAIEEDEKGNFWIAGELGALFYVDRITRNFERIPYPPKKFSWQHFDFVPNLLMDDQNVLWITTRSGLLNYDTKTQSYSMHMQNNNVSGSISNNDNNGLFKDSQGDVWIIGHQLNKYIRESADFIQYFDPEQPGIMEDNLTASKMAEDSEGNYWLATVHYGVVRFDATTKKFRTFVKDKFDRQRVMHLIVDSQDRLWYNRDNLGLFRFDIQSETEVLHITEADGLLHNAIQGIEEDEYGSLWISSHRGLSKYNPENGEFHHYFKEDGLQDNVFRFHASGKTRQNELMFGGQFGFNVFHPDNIQESRFIPHVIISDIEVNSRSMSADEVEGQSGNVIISDELHFTHNQNDLTFKFAALDFSLPERNLYTYILDNYDESWHPETHKTTAEYTNLDPGSYIFRVKGSNRDGLWNETARTMRVTIAPPWWQTWWAYICYGALLLGLLWLARIYELNRVHFKNQVKIEEAKLKEREEVDLLKSNFFTNISHEFRTPLTLIIGPLKKLLQETDDEGTANRLNIMQRNATRLLKLINQLLDISKLEAHELKLKASERDLVRFMKGTLMSFHSFAEQKGLSIEFESEEDEVYLFFDREKAEKIFSNLLSNAFKFTPSPGKISVSITRGEQHGVPGIFTTLRDTGVGIPKGDLENVFQRFQQVDNRLAREHEGSGIGLALTKELIDLHKGSIRVQSEENIGTQFVVFLPLGSAHLTKEEIIDNPAQTDSEDALTGVGDEISVDAPIIADEAQPLVLVVEDNTDMRLYINDVLGPVYRVEEAFDGEMGVERANDLLPDLIVSDLMMPKKDGFQLCRELKTNESTSHIPVILLTAKAERENRLEGLETGADDYLIKPFDSNELLIRIKNLISQRQRLRDRFSESIRVEASEITVTSMDAQFLQKAIDLVEENLEDDSFSVESFSEQIGLSRRQFYQKIKSITGLTPTEFILSIRLKRAAVLVSEKAGTISEIAYSVGFNNLSYFARAFKKQFGVTPSKYTPQSN